MNRNTQTEIRDKIQEKGARIGTENDKVIIELPTGSGKGKLCMMIIDRAPTSLKWLVVVPEILQIENLRRDLEKHKYSHLLQDKIEDIICYASLPKYEGTRFNLWLNECHRLSELKEDIAKTIAYERIIADSATIPANVRERLKNLGDFEQFSMSLQEAVEIGLLPEPKVYIQKLSFTPEGKKGYDKIEKEMRYWMDRSTDEGHPPWIGNKIKQLGSERKKYLAECKTEIARELINNLGNKRLLCYAGSVEQCNILGGEYAVNSKRKKKENLEVLRKFNEYEISRIYMNRMGREGLNLEGIQAVVMTQLSSGNDEGLEFIQKTGRSLRHDAPEIYLIVIKDSADEKYLHRALQKIDKNKIKYI